MVAMVITRLPELFEIAVVKICTHDVNVWIVSEGEIKIFFTAICFNRFEITINYNNLQGLAIDDYKKWDMSRNYIKTPLVRM